MTLVLLIVSGILLVIAVLWVAAMKSPEQYSGRIEKKFRIPITKVWDYISDIEGTPLRKKEIKRVEVLNKTGYEVRSWKEYTDMGGYILFEAASIPLERFEKRMIESSFGMTGTWLYELRGNEDVCILAITENSRTIKTMVKLALLFSGRDSNLKREMEIIEKFASMSSS